jgi:predicted MPP superfamily phosphohydrolase
MRSRSLRHALLERFVLNLALLLGAFQVLVWHWWVYVVRGAETPGAPVLAGTAAALVAANGLCVPLLRRHRRRRNLAGLLARGYTNLGIATLLVGLTLAVLWLLFLLPAGLLGALGGSADLAFGVFRAASIGAVGAVLLLLLWGGTFGRWAVARTHLRVAVPGLAPELAGLRLVQISDLHIGNGLEGRRLERMLERVNALAPDVVVVTGDIFDFDPACVEEGARALSRLCARHGVYAILGNHDIYTGADHIADAFARLAPNLRLLRDAWVTLPLPAPLHLAGVEDPGRGWAAKSLELATLERLAAERPADGPTLLLVHRPALFEQAARLGFPLVLAGHTHGGQLALPLPGGRLNLARLVAPHTRGVYRRGRTTLYVNRGLGVGGPALRVNCPREIATIELVPGDPTPGVSP